MLLIFFFNDTATTEIYTLSLHDALPISSATCRTPSASGGSATGHGSSRPPRTPLRVDLRRRRPAEHHRPVLVGGAHLKRSEEHTSELQSRQYLVCRLLLEKKKNTIHTLI